jgi:hypothetical protein
MFQVDPNSVLDEIDQLWIQQRILNTNDPKAVTVFSMNLRSSSNLETDTGCGAGVEIQFFEDA